MTTVLCAGKTKFGPVVRMDPRTKGCIRSRPCVKSPFAFAHYHRPSRDLAPASSAESHHQEMSNNATARELLDSMHAHTARLPDAKTIEALTRWRARLKSYETEGAEESFSPDEKVEWDELMSFAGECDRRVRRLVRHHLPVDFPLLTCL